MFTGIVEKVGKVVDVLPKGRGLTLVVDVGEVLKDLRIGESIAVDGVCLTLVRFDGNVLFFDVSYETVERSTVRYYRRGIFVNIERALRLGDRFGGHIVTGHVDTVGVIGEIKREGDFYKLIVRYPGVYSKYVAIKGSVAVDGISLTIANKFGDNFEVAVIPHTYSVTNLRYRRVGDFVNLEFDIIAKYIEALMGGYSGGSFESKLREFLGVDDDRS